jgi:hypothetical protein
MMCVCTANYAAIVNDIPMEKIIPTRGIRQHDPISSYLFHICAKASSSMLARVKSRAILTGFPTSKRGPHINHLFSADGRQAHNIGLR